MMRSYEINGRKDDFIKIVLFRPFLQRGGEMLGRAYLGKKYPYLKRKYAYLRKKYVYLKRKYPYLRKKYAYLAKTFVFSIKIELIT
jgi:hypothetical protein